MNFRERLKFLDEVRIGDIVRVEYERGKSKTANIQGQVYALRPDYVDIAEPDRDVFKDGVVWVWQSTMINFKDIIKYEIRDKINQEEVYDDFLSRL